MVEDGEDERTRKSYGTSFRTSVTFDPKRKLMLTHTHEGFHELLGLETWLEFQLK